MELGSGIAIAGLCVSGGAVAITAIKTYSSRIIEKHGKDGLHGQNGRNGSSAVFPCKEHSGIVACMEAIEKNQDRQEKWLSSISADVKRILQE